MSQVPLEIATKDGACVVLAERCRFTGWEELELYVHLKPGQTALWGVTEKRSGQGIGAPGGTRAAALLNAITELRKHPRAQILAVIQAAPTVAEHKAAIERGGPVSICSGRR